MANPHSRLRFHLLGFSASLLIICTLLLPAFASPPTSHPLGRKVAEKHKHGRSTLAKGFKLHLTHRAFADSSKGSLIEKMKIAMHRSDLRLKEYQNLISKKLASSAAANSIDDLTTPVSPSHGAYVTTVQIGTPGVSLTAMIDTGSDLVWGQCQPCNGLCQNQYGQKFDPSASSTYKIATCDDPLCQDLGMQAQCSASGCQFKYSYGTGDHGTSGDFSYDTLTLMDISGQPQTFPNFGFGCAHDVEGQQSSFADAAGLIGLGQGALSLPTQLNFKKLAYCLISPTESASQTSPLYLGDSVSINGNVQSTPLLTSSLNLAFYYVRLKGISVGDNSLDIPPGTFDLQSDGSGGVIFDSGTTLTLLTDAAYQPIVKAFQSSINLPTADSSQTGLDLCYQTTGSGGVEVPPLTFHFDGADFNPPQDNYFESFGDGLLCLAMQGATGLSVSILGNILQQNFNILYDRGGQTLSFASATCSSA